MKHAETFIRLTNSLVYIKFETNSAKFRTLPVRLTAISTILGAILFLRFGYAVLNVGLLGILGIIVIGHLATIPTALALAKIATNHHFIGFSAHKRSKYGNEYTLCNRFHSCYLACHFFYVRN